MFWCFCARKVLFVIKQNKCKLSWAPCCLAHDVCRLKIAKENFTWISNTRKIHKVMEKHLACIHWEISEDLWQLFKQHTFTSMHIHLYTPVLCAGNISRTRTVDLQTIAADTDTFGCFKCYTSSPTESSSSSTLSLRMTFTICTFSTATIPFSAVGVFPLRIQSGTPLIAKEK